MGFEALDFLVVDDHAIARSIVADIARATGVRSLREAEDGQTAFDMIRQRVPDIVILDFAMPHDGVALLRRIRSGPANLDPTLAVIAMTAYTDRRRVEMLRDAGANEIIAKPLTVGSLLARIVSVVDQPRRFVTSGTYFGPDRRRRRFGGYAGPLRRRDDAHMTIDVA